MHFGLFLQSHLLGHFRQTSDFVMINITSPKFDGKGREVANVTRNNRLYFTTGHKNYEAMMKDMKQYGFQPGMFGSPYLDPSFFGAEDHQIKPQKSANRRKTKRYVKSKHQTKRNAQKSN
jgi:hypothetical protein